MAHHHLRFKRSCSLKRNAYDDDDSGSADTYIANAGDCTENVGKKGDYAKEQRADKGNLADYSADKVAGRTTGTNTGNGAVVLLKVICHFNGIILNRYIEIAECNDKNEVKNRVEP